MTYNVLSGTLSLYYTTTTDLWQVVSDKMICCCFHVQLLPARFFHAMFFSDGLYIQSAISMYNYECLAIASTPERSILNCVSCIQQPHVRVHQVIYDISVLKCCTNTEVYATIHEVNSLAFSVMLYLLLCLLSIYCST